MIISNIYVITHKKFPMPEDSMYQPIQVGSYQKENLGYIQDNSGENISWKNENYCELTGIYWLWKNEKISDIIGICHYRRYFYHGDYLLREHEVIEKLKHYDVILPNSAMSQFGNILSHYKEKHHIKDLLICGDVIREKYPEFYGAFLIVVQSNFFTIGNMLITRKSIFDNYCRWLFDILFEVENRIDINGYDEYQRRVFGFLAERLQRVWFMNQRLRIREEMVYRVNERFQIQNELSDI